MSGLNIQRIRDIFDSVYDSATGVLKTSGSGGGGSSSITSNSSIEFNAGIATAKTQRVAIASDANSVVFASPQAVTLSSLPSLATGANAIGSITNTAFIANAGTNLNTSLLALESGGNLAGISGKLPSSLGSKTAANSLSVAIASDQTGIALLQSQTTLTQLTAAGSTAAVSMAGYSKAFITTLIASINTNVVIRIEGSNDNTNWANLSATSTDTTITANGTYGFSFVGCPQYLRVTFVSESGGTAVTVDAIVRVST